MASTIEQIKTELRGYVTADPVLGPLLNSDSAVAEFELWLEVMAKGLWTNENLYDFHKEDVEGIIAAQKPHRLQWYGTKAKAFQYGVDLPADSDVYAVVPPADAGVLVVDFAAAVELSNQVRIKVAKLTGSVLGALSGPELEAFTTYMNRVKDAGVRLLCTSGAADKLQPTMVIYYDPLVLKADGSRVDGTAATPVKDAVNAFLDGLPFNGLFILNSFIATMQAIPGVKVADVVAVQGSYGVGIVTPITTWYTPDGGYMALDGAYFIANVTYEAYV